MASSSLAAEFYVASQLYRQGYHALVTYGNMKALDLVAVKPEDNRTATIDVKSIKNKTNWPLTPKGKVGRAGHFYVFLSYHDRFEDLNSPPEVWVVPSTDLKGLLVPWSRAAKGQTCVAYRDLNKPAARAKYQDRWDQLFV